MSHPRIPTQLLIVAILFMIVGAIALINVFISLMHGNINLDFSVLGIFIGWGLIHLKRGWRTLALVLIWISMIGTPIFGILLLLNDGPMTFEVFGWRAGHIAKQAGLFLLAVFFAVVLWEYRVLVRPDIRRLFAVT